MLGLLALYTFLSPLGMASESGNPSMVLGVWAVLQIIVLFVVRDKEAK